VIGIWDVVYIIYVLLFVSCLCWYSECRHISVRRHTWLILILCKLNHVSSSMHYWCINNWLWWSRYRVCGNRCQRPARLKYNCNQHAFFFVRKCIALTIYIRNTHLQLRLTLSPLIFPPKRTLLNLFKLIPHQILI